MGAHQADQGGVPATTRIWLFLYGYPNLAGSVLGLLGVALLFLDVIRVGWLAITVGLYATGYVAVKVLRPEQEAALTESLRKSTLAESLGALVQTAHQRVPAKAASILTEIEELVQDLLGRLRLGDPLQVEQASLLEQTVISYLPHTLHSYLRLPQLYAGLHVVKDGKTPTDLLIDQLSLLRSGLRNMHENLAVNDTQSLLANGRFLSAKFSQGERFT